MPTFAYSPGQILDTVRQWFAQTYYQPPFISEDFDLVFTTFNGFRSVVIVLYKDGDYWNGDEFILASLAGTERAPLELFIRSPGWDGSVRAGFDDTLGGLRAYGPRVSYWADCLGDIKKGMVDNWSFGAWVSQTTNSQQYAAGLAGMASLSQLLVTDSGYYTSVEQCGLVDVTSGGPMPQMLLPPPSGSVDGNPSISFDTSGIVAALNSIANLDVTISFNQGQAVYSIKNREVTSP